MNKNKLIKIIFSIGIFIYILNFNVYAEEQNLPNCTNQGVNILENGLKYYCDIDNNVAKNQLVTINNIKMYFNEEGYAEKGFKRIDDALYFFSMITNETKTGWQSLEGKKFYCNTDGTVATGWREIDGDKYYFNEDGIIAKGFQVVDEKLYFFSTVNNKTKAGWQSLEGKKFYCNTDGTVATGWQEIDGDKYYFNEDGIIATGFQVVDEKLYFFSTVNNKTKTGWQSLEGKKFYCNTDGTVATGWQEIDGDKYYFNEDGIIATGIQKIGELVYMFNINSGKIMTGLQKCEDTYYYMSEEGYAETGWKEVNGLKYYFGEDYRGYKGFQIIDDKLYFFSNVNGALKKGWQNTNDSYFFCNDDGTVVTGTQTIESRDYIFSDEGLLQGFEQKDGKKYYHDPDGTLVKGVQRMVGTYLKFSELDGHFEKEVKQKIVIDISSHNGNIDWQKVKESGQVDAVILRLGYGVGYMDTAFLRNVTELNRLGIPYSVYLFSYAENGYEAGLEADFLIRTVRNNNVNIASDLFSIYYDLEDWEIAKTGEDSYSISKESYDDMIVTFVDKVESSLCIKTRVYASKNYILTRFNENSQKYATWVAQWGKELTYKGPYEGWQYTSDGSVDGIDGRVDMSIFYY